MSFDGRQVINPYAHLCLNPFRTGQCLSTQPVGLHASGAGITLREVRLHTPGWRSHSTGGFDLDHLVKNNYYLFNHTLYQWRSYYKQAQPMFEIRRGIPYTEPETP